MKIAQLILLGIIALGITACGNKGKLKSPSQIEEADAKKRAKMARTHSDDDTDMDDEELVKQQPANKIVATDPARLMNEPDVKASDEAE